MSKLLNSNRIGITDITKRLEHDIYTHVNQELNWQSRVILNHFREKIKELEITFIANDLDNQHPIAQVVINLIKNYLDDEEERLNVNSVNK